MDFLEIFTYARYNRVWKYWKYYVLTPSGSEFIKFFKKSQKIHNDDNDEGGGGGGGGGAVWGCANTTFSKITSLSNNLWY